MKSFLNKKRPSKEDVIALLSLAGIVLHLFLRSGAPLYGVLVLGGAPLVYGLSVKLLRREFSSDLLAGIAIVTSALLGEYLAGSIVVLMLSGGQALESYAVRSASSVLQALAKRIPSKTHRKEGSGIVDISLNDVAIGDFLVIYPHEICPVDGTVIEGHGVMDEAYLTGEPFRISKTPGAQVLSGAINGENALVIQSTRLPQDSRYAKIIEVMQRAEGNRPAIRRLGDQLGAWYTPLAVGLALVTGFFTDSAVRLLAVLVVATPCPLLLAIPIAIIGSISLAAKRGIIIKDPTGLEQIDLCKTIILDKTGTLTYGIPQLMGETVTPGFERDLVLKWVASLEQYSKHPLAQAILKAAAESKLALSEASHMSEPPGQGLRGVVSGKNILITNRKNLLKQIPQADLPPMGEGLECVVAVDGIYAAVYRFRDGPRLESRPFVGHLGKKHGFEKIMLVSGDRESEVRYLADLVKIGEVHASKSPEEKVTIVRDETEKAKTLFIGDGINDAPALMTATVGIALGQSSDITTKAASVVIMESSLAKVDEFFHISRRMRSIALQSAVGGMILSIVGMVFAAAGYLTPVAGAVAQEVIDVLAIANALRAAWPPRKLVDF